MKEKLFSHLAEDGIKSARHIGRYRASRQSSFSASRESFGQASTVTLMPYDESVRRLMRPKKSRSFNRTPMNPVLVAKFSDGVPAERTNPQLPVLENLCTRILNIKNREPIPFKLKAELQASPLIKSSLKGRVRKNTTDIELLCRIHDRVRYFLLEALAENDRANYEVYQHKMLMALRLIFELKNAIRQDQGRFSIELQRGYQTIFIQLNEQIDFCDTEQVKLMMGVFRIITKAWHSHWFRRNKIKQLQGVVSQNQVHRKSYSGLLMKRSMQEDLTTPHFRHIGVSVDRHLSTLR